MRMESSETLTRLAGILEVRQQAASRPYNLLLTSTLSLTPTILQNICHSDNWSVFRQFMYDLGQRDRLHALRPLLQTSPHSDGYRALARLITRRYFSTILTTNIDSALENALDDVLIEGGQRPRSFQTLVLDRDTDEHVVQALDDRTDGICIVKLHGSLQDNVIPASFPDFFELRDDVLESVKRYLNQDLIIVGSIEHEDDMNRALTRYGGSSVYSVLPEMLAPDDNIVKLMKARAKDPEKYMITEQYGDFDLFFTTLEALLLNKTATSPEQRKRLSLHEEQPSTRGHVISNSISAYKQTISMHPSEVRVTDLARSLELRKNTSRGTVLFLGARAGGLFRSKLFYDTFEKSSTRTFSNMSQVEQFAQCYRVLKREGFTESDLDEILFASLQDLSVSNADICLAELVKKGIFDVIISTDVDNLLEKAFVHVKMAEAYDFRVFIPQQGFMEDIIDLETQPSCILIKVFGNFALKECVINKRDLYIEDYEGLKNVLASHLKNEVLMIGYDPLWDRAIDSIFPTEGQEFWFVNEEKCGESPVFRALQNRKGKYIVGGEGSYERFVQSLHWHMLRGALHKYQLNGNKSVNRFISSRVLPTARMPQAFTDLSPSIKKDDLSIPISPALKSEQRQRVCIFYSQIDKKHLLQLMNHFKHFERKGLLDVWADIKISAGKNWIEEIQETMKVLRVAVLLVSADFLASSFIAENILPPLLKAADTHGATIIPVLLGHCVFEDTALAQFRAFNDPAKPLNTKKSSDRSKDWADLVRYVVTLVKDA